MKNNYRYIITICFFFCWCISGFAQIEAYEYRAPIENVKQGWNKIEFEPYDISKVKNDMSDIRIYRKDAANDTYIEQPYLLDIPGAKIEKNEVLFKIINPTQKADVYTFTFELSNTEEVNKIILDFANKNYDWKIKVEGSMDQNSWLRIKEKARIVSLVNSESNFQYSHINIPSSKFNFYRITFASSEAPKLLKASLCKEKIVERPVVYFIPKNINHKEQKKAKTSTIEIDLETTLPISQIEIHPKSSNDYYRAISIQTAIDSFETETGWHNNYQSTKNGILNSLGDNIFRFSPRKAKKILITVRNYDNQALEIGDISVAGPQYFLITKIETSDSLFLAYGNKNAQKPVYDLAYFKDRVPDEIDLADVEESVHYPKSSDDSNPLFKNKWWLWGIMIFVILLLGFFSFKMVKEK